MVRHSRRRFLAGMGVTAAAGIGGCLGEEDGDGGDGGDGDGGDGGTVGDADDDPGTGDMREVTIPLPEGTIHYPMYEAAVDSGAFEEEGVDLTVEYLPFDAQVQAITAGEADTTMTSFFPYVDQYLLGEDVVCFGFDGTLQLVNSMYCRADSEYESIPDLEGEGLGVWSWGSSTVQSFEALVADEYGLQLQEDFETTTAAPPALLGLLDDGEVDAIINVSGLSITMEAQPDTYRNLGGLNEIWQERTGHTLPLTAWFSYADWYEDNEGLAADLLAGGRNAAEHWRENTREILEEYGEPGGVETDAEIDVVDEWSEDGWVFKREAEQEYVDATWDFAGLMAEEGFIDEVPDRDEFLRQPQ